MKRYPAFEPPEYVSWKPEPEVMDEFRTIIASDEGRREIIGGLEPEQHLALYRGLIRNRLFDVMLKRWVWQGVISKAWLGTGEEGVTIGAVHALVKGDVVGPMIRNSGAFHEMGISLSDLFRTYLGTADSPTAGVDIHLGRLELGVVAPISMVGALVPVCAGVALAFKLQKKDNVALTWAGDGTTRTTDFHEGLICAREMSVPLIVIVQDNQIALGTTDASYSRVPMEEVATIYGVRRFICNGNHVLDVYAATFQAAELCRAGKGPVIINAKTLRMGGHATHDEGESRDILSPDLFEFWGKRDPVGMYETYLAESEMSLSREWSNREALERIEVEVIGEVNQAAGLTLVSRRHAMPKPQSACAGQ
jgi:TPP-dependent pyruvate/acetoin dehydrogenase alpha subunit